MSTSVERVADWLARAIGLNKLAERLAQMEWAIGALFTLQDRTVDLLASMIEYFNSRQKDAKAEDLAVLRSLTEGLESLAREKKRIREGLKVR